MSNQFKKTQNHPFHLVDPSPWPIFASLSCLILTFGGVIYIHNFIGGNYILTLGFVIVLFTIAVCCFEFKTSLKSVSSILL